MTRFERIRKHWIWLLIGFIISTIIGLISIYFEYRSNQHELGGLLNATFHSRILNNREARTIVVCMEDTTIDLANLYITPTFDNPAEYSLKDFSLSFDVECTNVHIIPTSFVDAHKYEKDEWIFKYKDNILAAHDDTKKPFSHFVLSDTKGRCYIKTKASYDGAVDAFLYNTDVWFIVEPNKKHLSFDDWKINCKKRIFEFIEDTKFDVYYISKYNNPEFQFDVVLQSSDKKSNKPKIDNSSPEWENTIKESFNNENASFVSFEEVSQFDEKSHAELEIDDYIIQYSDTTQITLLLNKPAKKDGMFVLSYLSLKGLKTVRNYAIFEVYKGQMESKIKLLSNQKIADLCLYHQICPNNNYKIIKNNDGDLELSTRRQSSLLAAKNTDGQFGIFNMQNCYLSTHFSDSVSLYAFDINKPFWNGIVQKENGEDKYLWLIIYLSLVLFVFVCFYFADIFEDNEKASKAIFVIAFASTGILLLPLLLMGLYTLYVISKVIYIYIYLLL